MYTEKNTKQLITQTEQLLLDKYLSPNEWYFNKGALTILKKLSQYTDSFKKFENLSTNTMVYIVKLSLNLSKSENVVVETYHQGRTDTEYEWIISINDKLFSVYIDNETFDMNFYHDKIMLETHNQYKVQQIIREELANLI